MHGCPGFVWPGLTGSGVVGAGPKSIKQFCKIVLNDASAGKTVYLHKIDFEIIGKNKFSFRFFFW
jgi:hypothetical protein